MTLTIDTVRFASIPLSLDELAVSPYTTFIVSHKSEDLETLLGVLWFLPESSPVIVVTNCPPHELAALVGELRERFLDQRRGSIYLIHQKDAQVAALFRECGVNQILGEDGRAVDGKGEGMYIGTLGAASQEACRWVVYYDADNFVPSNLLEYTLAMARLFTSPTNYGRLSKGALQESGPCVLERGMVERENPALHNVRICWAGKPVLGNGNAQEKLLGRSTRVVSPLFTTLLAECFGIHDAAIVSSNAGEQAMTMQTAKTLRFSSRFSVETFQLLDLLFHAEHGSVLLHQYQARSPHFHDKKDDGHIKGMTAESLGCFSFFSALVSRRVEAAVQQVCDELSICPRLPIVYPALDMLGIQDATFLGRYELSVAPDQIGDLEVYGTVGAAQA